MIHIPSNLQARLNDIGALTEEERIVSHDQHCSTCGKEGQLKCGKCKVSRYCSKECQIKHWLTHKQACKVDCEVHEHIPKVESRGFFYDPRCSHGAPTSEGAVVAINFFTYIESEKLHCRYKEMNSSDKAHFDLQFCITYCKENPKDAVRPDISQLLWSVAVMAFMDSHADVSREFVKLAVFFESFVIGRAGFIECLSPGYTDESAPENPGFTHLDKTMEQIVSRKGLVEALKLRITCGCMREKPVVKKSK